jgi:uncharacterized protein YecA (UPF0149 family)
MSSKLAVLLGAWLIGHKRKGRTVAGGQSPDRNKPCPCGSGKKFKKCCGPQGTNLYGGI